MYQKECPRIGMNFAYQHKETNEIHTVSNVLTAPVKDYDKNPMFTKLYESAFVKVIHVGFTLIPTIINFIFPGRRLAQTSFQCMFKK